MRTPSSFAIAPLVAAATLALAGAAQASSHREAPFISGQPKVDASDFYLFNSYEAGRSDYVTLIADYQPMQNGFDGPNYHAMDPNALYEIHVDNNGDGVEDLTFQFRFQSPIANSGAGLGDGPTFAIFTAAVLLLVIYLSVARPDVQDPHASI